VVPVPPKRQPVCILPYKFLKSQSGTRKGRGAPDWTTVPLPVRKTGPQNLGAQAATQFIRSPAVFPNNAVNVERLLCGHNLIAGKPAAFGAQFGRERTGATSSRYSRKLITHLACFEPGPIGEKSLDGRGAGARSWLALLGLLESSNDVFG
jgi:hypothetical protein